MYKQYRYILNGHVNPDDPINKFRLISGHELINSRRHDVIRVVIPEDMTIEKLSCDNYSTTEDTRTISQLEPTVMIRINGVWIVKQDIPLNQYQDISDILRKNENLILTTKGYLHIDQYREYMNDIAEKQKEQEERAQKLKHELDNGKCSVSDLEFYSKEDILKILELYVKPKNKMQL